MMIKVKIEMLWEKKTKEKLLHRNNRGNKVIDNLFVTQ